MRKSVLLSTAALISLSASINAVFAADDDPSESIVVTGRKLEEELPQLLAQTGTRVDTISAAEIKNGGYLDVSQALQAMAPGLYVASKNGPFDYVDISFQGSRTEDVLWLVDGIRINNRLYAGTTPLDTLPASMIDRIEVLEGGESLFYGTQAAAGAVNIVTKGFSDKLDGAFTVGADTNSGKHVDGYLRDTIDGHQFVIFASHDQSDGIKPFPDADFQPSATQRDRAYNVTTFGGKYGYDFSDAFRLSASYQHTDAKLDDTQPESAAVAFNSRDEDLLSAKLDYTPSDAMQFFAKGYYHRWHSHYTEFDNDLANPGTLDVIENNGPWGFTDYGVNAMGKAELIPGLEAVLGYDFQNYNGSDAVLVIQPQTEEVQAVFGQLRLTPDLIPKLHFAAGLRYNAPSVGESALVWNTSGQFDITDSLFLKGSVGTSFRLPTAEELFANDPNDERGNPNLKAERGTNVNVSFGGKFDLASVALRWAAIGFYRDTKNLIDFTSFDSATNQDVFGNVAGTVKERGGEFTLDAAFSDVMSGNFSYTHTKATQDGSSLQFSRIPADLFKATLDYHPTALPFAVGATVNYVGNVYNTIGGGVGRIDYGNHAILDLNAHTFLDTEHHHRIDLHLDNVFDKVYASQLSRGFRDTDGSSYVVHDLGLPRTLLVNYTYAFN